jgi:hypothetical protein
MKYLSRRVVSKAQYSPLEVSETNEGMSLCSNKINNKKKKKKKKKRKK